MKPFQKVLTTCLWVVMVLVMVSVIGAQWWRQKVTASELPVHKDAPAFELVDQDGQTVTLASLAGKPWIADFIFTQCAGPCPLMTQKMAGLQKEIDSPNVRFVSFSVDPQRDTPAVLKEYAQRFGADESRWRFLTGEADQIMATSQGMWLALDPGTGEPQSITHSTKFVLIDADGQIRQYYDSNDETQMAALVQDAKALAGER